jgi:hypothetical protein
MLHVFYTNQVKLAGTKTRNDTQLGTERVHVHVSCPSRAAPATVEAWKQSMLLGRRSTSVVRLSALIISIFIL